MIFCGPYNIIINHKASLNLENELKVPSEIDRVRDRKLLQKAVYLGQLSGFDLGYRFGWYLMGPYCTSLARDYYSLNEAIATGDCEYENKELKASLRKKLERVRSLIESSPPSGLSASDWLELLSSVHFLREIQKKTPDQTRDIIRKEKPTLLPYYDLANDTLSSFRFLV